MENSQGPRRRRPPATKQQSKKRSRPAVWGRCWARTGRFFGLATTWLNQPLGAFASPGQTSNRYWQALTRPRPLAPLYLRQSWAEVRCVTWPQFPQALRLTWAVVVFAAILSVLVATVDWILTEVFKEIIINKSANIRVFFDNLF